MNIIVNQSTDPPHRLKYELVFHLDFFSLGSERPLLPIRLHLHYHLPEEHFHNTLLLWLHINHISVSFIRLNVHMKYQHHRGRLFLHHDSKVTSPPAPFSASPNINPTMN